MVSRSLITDGANGFRSDIHSAPGFIKLHFAVNEGEESPIPARADILPGLKLGPALPDQNAARSYKFAAKPLYTQPLADAIASVADTALTFLVCHKNLSLTR